MQICYCELSCSLLLNSFIFVIVIITSCVTWIKMLLATPRVKNGKVSVLEEAAEIFQDGDLFWKAIISFLWQSQCAFSCLSILCASYVFLCVVLKACTHLASITLILVEKIALLSFKSLVIALVTCIPWWIEVYGSVVWSVICFYMECSPVH